VSKRGIFIAEFDDDYQDAARLSNATLQRRVRCYFLLAPSLLIHPAYIWQAPVTHSLITREMADIFAPPYTNIALGDSPGLSEYMHQRIGALSGRKVKEITHELVQYQRWGRDLEAQAAELDNRFGPASGVVFQTSRDTMFRELLLRDLSTQAVAGVSLQEMIRAYYIRQAEARKAGATITALRGFIRNSSLVSLDSLVSFLAARGLLDLARSPGFYNRMLVLYYRANVDDNYVVAGLPTLDPDDPTIHPYDPQLFWRVVGHVFGEKTAKALADDRSSEVRDLLHRLKNDSDWQNFTTQYSDLRDGMDQVLKAGVSEIAQELEISTQYAKLKLLPRIWREQKAELITTILGLAFTAPSTAGPLVLTIGGGLTALVGSVLALRPIRRFRDEYELNSLRRLKTTLRREMRLLAGW
jgi:hypothetical protein